MLRELPEWVPLKILVSGRPYHTPNSFPMDGTTKAINLFQESTQGDLHLFAEHEFNQFAHLKSETEKALIPDLVRRAAGNFLWMRLIIPQLNNCHTKKDKQMLLNQVPDELTKIYQSNVNSIDAKDTGCATEILTWIKFAVRPLKRDEVHDIAAKQLAINRSGQLDTISHTCGHLVDVDQQSRVQWVHPTARTFLETYKGDKIKIPVFEEGHSRLALGCLRCLSSEDLEVMVKQAVRPSSQGEGQSPEPTIQTYACTAFSEHIASARSTDQALGTSLEAFLNDGVLTWIEYMAQRRELSQIVKAADDLNIYARSRTEAIGAIDDHAQKVKAWATTLRWLVSNFGRNLLDRPSAVHRLIPPLCPPDSPIYAQSINLKNPVFTGAGIDHVKWNDRISFFFESKRARCVASRGEWYAVGLDKGDIHVYHARTSQELVILNHGEEAVQMLESDCAAKYLGSAGLSSVVIWNVQEGVKIITAQYSHTPMCMAFSKSQTQSSSLIVIDGTFEKHTLNLPQARINLARNSPADEGQLMGPRHGDKAGTVSKVEISAEHDVVSIAYRSKQLEIWTLSTNTLIGKCSRKDEKPHTVQCPVNSVAFSPTARKFAVAYWHGAIELFSFEDKSAISHEASFAHANSQILRVSPDGKLLAAGNSGSTVRVLCFDSLELLHSFSSSEDGLAALAFTSDNSRLLLAEAHHLHVWGLPVLAHTCKGPDRVNSKGDPLCESSIGRWREPGVVTSLVCDSTGQYAICGRSNGAIQKYDLTKLAADSATLPIPLYSHKSTPMGTKVLLDWVADAPRADGLGMLASANAARRASHNHHSSLLRSMSP